MNEHVWHFTRGGRVPQVLFENGADIASLGELDERAWLALSMPVGSVRYDRRTLELLDGDGDGRVRLADLVGAVEFLISKGVDLATLFTSDPEDAQRLHDVTVRAADVAKLPPSDEEAAALAAWEAQGRDPSVVPLGAATAEAEAALAAVESVIDGFFTPAEDLPLVTQEPDATLPLSGNINPKYAEAIAAFAEKCAKPLLGEIAVLDRAGWKRVRAAFAPYRAWCAAKPEMHAAAAAELRDEERVIRYRMNLLELLENFANMRRLYANEGRAIFQTGVLHIDGRELRLCFHVDDEAAHAALAERSRCCLVYAQLTRPAEKVEAHVCAVVTAGRIDGYYVGRNGLFTDRDGRDWEATVTKVIECPVSLLEAFWSPWRKLGQGVSDTVKKFLSARQTTAVTNVSKALAAPAATTPAAPASANGNGAALASSVAAVGIGVGMVGAAAATVMRAVAGMAWWQILVSLAVIVLAVSLPSVILTWFKLRNRDLGAILNACGWAVNRPLRLTFRQGRAFTR